MKTDWDIVKKELTKRLRSLEDLHFYEGSKEVRVASCNPTFIDDKTESKDSDYIITGGCRIAIFDENDPEGINTLESPKRFEISCKICGDSIEKIYNDRVSITNQY